MTRRGAMMIELAVAGALAAALLVLCLQLLAAALAHRKLIDQRQCAMVELDNIMERVAFMPWSELTSDHLAEEKLSDWAKRQLPGAELKIQVTTPDDDPNAKRIAAALGWQTPGGKPLAPVTLTTWKYNIAKATEP